MPVPPVRLRPTIPYALARRFDVAATAPAPTPQPLAAPPTDKPTTGERWAFWAFVILFLLTLIIGLLHFLFSFFKYRS
jgi:hypothetical protein